MNDWNGSMEVLDLRTPLHIDKRHCCGY